MQQVLGIDIKTQKDIYAVRDLLENSISQEAREKMGSAINTLHYIGCIELPSTRMDRLVQGQVVVSYKIVGGKFVSDIPIKVPRIPLGENPTLENILKRLTWENKEAGEEFCLTYLEYMFLITQVQYAGYCYDNNLEKEISICYRTAKFLRGDQALPTPTFRSTNGGSIKDNVFDIEYFDGDNKCWVMYPEYKEKFLVFTLDRKKKRKFTMESSETYENVKDKMQNFYSYLTENLGFDVSERIDLSNASKKDKPPVEVLDVIRVQDGGVSKTVNNTLFIARYIWENIGIDFGWGFSVKEKSVNK